MPTLIDIFQRIKLFFASPSHQSVAKEDMQLYHRIENDICITNVNGNLTWDTKTEFREYMDSVLETESFKGLIINLEKTHLITSVGLGLIIAVLKKLQTRNIPLAVCELNVNNQELFYIAQLDKMMQLYETKAEAIEGIRGNLN